MSDANLPIPPATSAENASALAGAPRLSPTRPAGDDAALRQAAKDFESVLLEKMLSSMGETVLHSGLLDSPATKQTEGMFWSYLARDLADKGGLGLWRDIYDQWSRMGVAGETDGGTGDAEPSPAEGAASLEVRR